MKYKLKKGVIVKSDFEIEYNKEDFINVIKDVEKKITELEAQNKIYIAKRDNVARNYPHVLKRTDEERNAIWLYQENMVASKQIETLIKKMTKDLKDIIKETKEITKQTGLKFD